MLNIIEAFTGIGSFTMGIQRVCGKGNINVLGSYELDKHAVKSYNAIQGTNHVPTDIRDTDFSIFQNVDWLFGGWPCQSLSNAGYQKGMGEQIAKRSHWLVLVNKCVAYVLVGLHFQTGDQ